MPRIIQTTASGSPLPDYLTQSPRQKVINLTQRNQFQALPSGIRYAYSGNFGSGAEAAISVTLLDIADSGDEDLLTTLSFSANTDQISSGDAYGFSLSINGTEVFFSRSADQDRSNHMVLPYEFILPAHSALVVLGISETITAERCASIIGRPIS